MGINKRGAELHQAIQRACRDLPTGFTIVVRLEDGAGWVELEDDAGEDNDVHTGEGIAADIDAAVEVAREMAEDKKGGA